MSTRQSSAHSTVFVMKNKRDPVLPQIRVKSPNHSGRRRSLQSDADDPSVSVAVQELPLAEHRTKSTLITMTSSLFYKRLPLLPPLVTIKQPANLSDTTSDTIPTPPTSAHSHRSSSSRNLVIEGTLEEQEEEVVSVRPFHWPPKKYSI
ncbi:hypothetical protein HDU91_000473 [Kappamyces sp. JEL0680]|nr:hypothetical protein HDU91_000473 [Kappamyces sp. JEL0680]